MSERPTAREIETISTSPRRFRRWRQRADEVRIHAAGHRGALPEWCWELTDTEWDELAATLCELDRLDWARELVA